MDKKKADIIFFSRTGNTKKIAEVIFRELLSKADAKIIEIKTKKNYPYLVWLGLSFLPNFGVKIECEDVTADLVFICFPKWTLNCPPITAFLRQGNLQEKTVWVVITYGGFDAQRYAAWYKKKIEKLCKEVRGIFLLRRSKIKRGELGEIKKWVATALKD